MKRLLTAIGLAVLLGAQSASAVTNLVSGELTGTVNWVRTNVYTLTGYTYVLSNAVLNIEPGTVIRGRDGIAPNFGALFVCRGGTINAIGTPILPIIFTAEDDDLTDPEDYGPDDVQLWGGVILLGNARINNTSFTPVPSPIEDVYEGLNKDQTGSNGQFLFRFGGPDDEDSSGCLRFVSIRHAGKILESNKEINGLSMAGVGRGTVIEFVETYAGSDDGFEFFGGSVNTRYLVSAFNQDEMFDTDQGYNGKNQFWFGIQGNTADLGSEQNGQPSGPPVIPNSEPLGSFEVYNWTMIGRPGAVAGNDSLRLRVQNFNKIYNSVFTEFGGARCNIDGTSQPDVRNNLFFGQSSDGTGYNTAFCPADVNPIANPLLKGTSRIQDGGLDPRPSDASPAFAGVRSTPVDGFYCYAPYKGAFDGKDNWMRGWTALWANGHLPPQTNVVTISGELTGTHNWVHTNIYLLDGYVYVLSNAVLNIEPGTIIQGVDDVAPNFGTLFVCRGGKINAEGTSVSPIVFTAEGDDIYDVTDFDPSFASDHQLWGGIVLLGKARINNSSQSIGSPIEDVYEGLNFNAMATTGEFLYRFGGSDDDDSSGVLRYVSIRHGGKALESNKEINGLSLAGVGRGTTLECIEVIGNSDDGFEWFGGSVNSRYLVSAFNEDETFDTDQGFNGKNQFWFSLQHPSFGDMGSEQNGQPSGPPVIPGGLPLGSFEVHNWTMIGRGTDNGNLCIRMRVQNFNRIYNSIFTEFGGARIDIDGTSQPDVRYNLWFGHTSDGTGYGGIYCPAVVNPIADPLLGGIAYGNSPTNDFVLDPRPTGGSPALSGFSQPNLDGFFVPVPHKGAFDSTGNWMMDWTMLATHGYVKPVCVTVKDKNVPVAQPTIANNTAGEKLVSWTSTSGQKYLVQCTSALTQSTTWSNVSLVIGTGTTLTYTNATSDAQAYWRVVSVK